MKSLKVKIELDYNQEIIINTLSDEHRLLYNHLLNFCKTNGVDFKLLNQCYKNYRNDNQLTINSKSAQNTCIMLIESIKSYFKLRKTDKTAKFPYHFKSYQFFKTFMYDYNKGNGGFKIVDNKLVINLLSKSAKSKKLIIDLNEYVTDTITKDNIKTVLIKKEDEDYYLCFSYENETTNHNLNKDKFLSIDPGVKNIVTGFTNVGEWFTIKNKTFKCLEKHIKKCKSKLDKKKKHSKKYKKLQKRFQKLNKDLSNKNQDFQYQTSSKLIKYCIKNDIGTVIIGDIETKKLKDSNIANKGLNKSTQNRGTLSRFQTFFENGSKNENIDFYKQDESYTSKTNCLTDKLFDFNLTLKDREVRVDDDLVINRDLNGSINIAKKAKVGWFSQIDLKEEILLLNRMYI